MKNNTVQNVVHGFKVFRPDWTCSPNGNTKQYTCPGKFEEEGELDVCGHGMHFCQIAADCFNYYSFDSSNKVAEVIAYGDVRTDGNKSCTDKLEIVREITWDEVLRIVNIGKIARVTATPETAIPETATLGAATLETAIPGTATLGTGTLGAATPGTTTLGATTPGTTTLGAATPGTATLDTGIPETATPETTTPGTATLGTGTNRLLILAVLIQKNRRSCYLISRQV